MTSLQILILSAMHRHGPQSAMGLWHHSACQPLTAVLISIAELEDAERISKVPAHQRPERFACDEVAYWQITEKGQQLIAGKKQPQEVCLGSK
jgi:hypothetical protein